MNVINPLTPIGTHVHASFCEGMHCCAPDAEVRVYPILSVSRAARVILCRPCWEHENRYRHQRGKDLRCPEHWPTRDWDKAQCYPEEAGLNEASAGPTLLARAA
jgi:hypothetical protein